MKQIIMIMMLILSSALVIAVPAGSTNIVTSFDKCDTLRVNVSGNLVIEDNEYSLIDCNETDLNSWYCDCSDDYDLKLSTTIKTLNDYTFNIRHNFSDVLTEVKHSSSSSSSSSYTIPEVKEYVYVYSGQITNFKILNSSHTIKLLSHINDIYRFEIRSEPQIVELRENQSKIIIVDNIQVKISLVKGNDNYIKLKIEEVILPVTTSTTSTTTTTIPNIIINSNDSVKITNRNTTTTIPSKDIPEKERSPWGVIIFTVLGICIVIGFVLFNNRKEK